MKTIEALIRHEAFEPIRMELLDKGFPVMPIHSVQAPISAGNRPRGQRRAGDRSPQRTYAAVICSGQCDQRSGTRPDRR